MILLICCYQRRKGWMAELQGWALFSFIFFPTLWSQITMGSGKRKSLLSGGKVLCVDVRNRA